MLKTVVTRSRKFEKQLRKLPEELRIKVKFWIFAVSMNGIAEARKRPGYHDEPLKGHRKGQRSIRLNKSYRLIYMETEKCVHIMLLEVNKHDYR